MVVFNALGNIDDIKVILVIKNIVLGQIGMDKLAAVK